MRSIARELNSAEGSLFKQASYSINSIQFDVPKPKLGSENELQGKNEETTFIKECYKTMYKNALNDSDYQRCALILLEAGSAKIFLDMPAPLHSNIIKALDEYLTSSSRSLEDFDYDSDDEDTHDDKTEKGKIVQFYKEQSEALSKNSAPGNVGGTTSQYASVTSNTSTTVTNSNEPIHQQKLKK